MGKRVEGEKREEGEGVRRWGGRTGRREKEK